jgi:hypothetical protein
MSNYAAETLCYSLPVTKSLNTYAPQANQYEVYATSCASSGLLTDNLPIAALPVAKAGCLAASWGTDLFERILINHFQPRVRDVGDIMADQTIEFYIWNTHTIDKTCTAITKTGDTGLTLTGPVPTFHNHPFKAVEYDLTISMNGPAQINASYEWDYGQTYDLILGVIGKRIRLLPIKHNWENKMKISCAAETVISMTKKLYEQRRPMFAKVRREISLLETQATPKIQNLLSAFGNYYFGIPIIVEPITPVAGQGNINLLTTINVEETLSQYFHMQHSDYVVVWNDVTDETEALQVASLGVTSIVLAYASLQTWNLDNCTLYPMLRCIVNSIDTEHITDNVYETRLTATEFITGD